MLATVRRPPPIIQKHTVLLFLLMLAIVCGWGLGNVYLLALGEIYLVVLLLGYRGARRMFDSVAAEREHYPRTFEGSQVHVLLRAKTGRRQPIYLLEVQDTFPPAGDERVRHLLRTPFDARRHYEIHYEKTCARRRGPYVIGPVHLRAADPLGLFMQSTLVPAITNLLVYPQARELPGFGVLGRGTLFHVGQETSRRPGQSEEFVGLRDYQPGDSPLRIHWPSSARHGRFIVKDFQETVVTEVTLIVDLTRVSHTGVGDQTSTELIVRAAAAIAARAIELSHLVEVYAAAAQTAYTPLGGGQQQLVTILDGMALYRADGRQPFTQCWAEIAPLARRGSTTVAVCAAAALDLAQAEEIVRGLTLSGVRVIVVPIDERGFIKLILEQEALHAKAAPFNELVERLRIAGAEVFPLRAADDVRRALVQ